MVSIKACRLGLFGSTFLEKLACQFIGDLFFHIELIGLNELN